MAIGNSQGDAGRSQEGVPSVRKRNPRRWKSLLWIIPLVLVLFVVISDLFGWAYLRGPVATFLSAKLDRKVEIGTPFSVHLRRTIPIKVGSLFIAAPEWSEEPHFVKLEGLEADLDWGVIVGRQPLLRRLLLAKADVRAERDQQGRASWSMGTGDKSSSNGPVVPAIEQLSIGDASIKVNDAMNDLRLEVDARAGEGSTQQGAGQAANGGLVVDGKGTWKGDPLTFEVRSAGLLPLLEKESNTRIEVKGKLKETALAFSGTLDLAQLGNLSGKVSGQGASLGGLTAIPGLTLPSTPPYQLDATIDRSGSLVKVDVSRAEMGSSRMKAQLEYDGAATPPTLRGSLDASRLALQDLGPSIGASASSASPSSASPAPSAPPKSPASAGRAAKSARVLPTKEFDLPSLRAMNADVDIDLKQLDLGTAALRPLHSLKAKLLLDGGVLKLRDVTSSLAGGTVSGSVSLDGSSADKAPTFDTNLKWSRVDLKNWLKVSGGDYFVAGRFSGQTLLKGGGTSTAAILDSLGGSVKGHIDGGSISHQLVEIAGLDVAQALGVLFIGDQPLTLSCALVDLTANKGTVKSNLFLLNTKDTIFFVEGGVDFKSERLNLRLVQSPKDWTPVSLRSPITITGTFAKPAVGVEAAPIALKVLSSLVLASVTPLAALLPLIDLGEESTREGCAPAIAQVKTKAAESGAQPAASAAAEEGKPPGSGGTDGNGVLRRPGRLPGERP